MQVHSILPVWLWSVMLALLASRGGSEPVPLISSSDGLTLTSSVTEIVPALTDIAIMKCSFTKQESPGVLMLASMILKQWDSSKNTYQDILRISLGHTEVESLVPIQGVTDGALDKDGKSFLSITWPYPSGKVAGKYQCSAHTLLLSSYPKVISVDIELRLRNAELPDLVNALREMKERQQKMNTTQKNVELYHENGFTSLEIRGYILYWSTKYMSFQDAKRVCTATGGQLSEVSFETMTLNKTPLQRAGMTGDNFWIGITRAGTNSPWVYVSTGASVGNIKWVNAPDTYEYCATFGHSWTDGYDPDPCGQHGRVLCAKRV